MTCGSYSRTVLKQNPSMNKEFLMQVVFVFLPFWNLFAPEIKLVSSLISIPRTFLDYPWDWFNIKNTPIWIGLFINAKKNQIGLDDSWLNYSTLLTLVVWKNEQFYLNNEDIPLYPNLFGLWVQIGRFQIIRDTELCESLYFLSLRWQVLYQEWRVRNLTKSVRFLCWCRVKG